VDSWVFGGAGIASSLLAKATHPELIIGSDPRGSES
jgi:hypothetical protein